MAALARMRPRGRGTIVQVGRATARLYGERGANVGLIARGQAGLEGAEVRDAVLPDVTAGEYGHDLHYFRRMCAAGAVDCLQADISRCGAITEWLRVAAVAASHGLQISGHCGPHLHAHAAAATPNLRHLEWFHDYVRIESLFFDGTLQPACTWSASVFRRRRSGTITRASATPRCGRCTMTSSRRRSFIARCGTPT